MSDRIRELEAEVARLQAAEAEAWALVLSHEGRIAALTAERDFLRSATRYSIRVRARRHAEKTIRALPTTARALPAVIHDTDHGCAAVVAPKVLPEGARCFVVVEVMSTAQEER